MSALSARNPMLSDPRADCVAGKSPGFPRRRSGESCLMSADGGQRAQLPPAGFALDALRSLFC